MVEKLKIRALVLTAIVAGLCACEGSPSSNYEASLTEEACKISSSRPEDVSIELLTSQPEKFHDTYVRLNGFYCSGFEESGLYPSPGCEHDKKSGVWLTGTSPASNFRGQRIVITGKVDAANNGHLALWAAQVCVSTIEVIDGRPTDVERLR
ncbi:hypothetical protein [Stenotrophomonas sp.]|uniref:hypothetical protein n=1 Tax=Stenotrophomonas sp. TaxID=69392 RepID=UPI0028A8674B|nr:hypothetical protein [Stenotrophomonas sp.]